MVDYCLGDIILPVGCLQYPDFGSPLRDRLFYEGWLLELVSRYQGYKGWWLWQIIHHILVIIIIIIITVWSTIVLSPREVAIPGNLNVVCVPCCLTSLKSVSSLAC